MRPIWTWQPLGIGYVVHDRFAADCEGARETIAGYFAPKTAGDLGCTDVGDPARAFLVYALDEHDKVLAWASSPVGHGLGIMEPECPMVPGIR